MSDADRPRLTSVVPFLFGVSDRSRLPGTALVELLTATGASETAARSVLARMRADGGLLSIRHGRRTDYELAGLVKEAFVRARAQGHPEPTPPPGNWSGTFHGLLYAVPEAERAHRDRLRHAARLAGYASLRPGLSIAIQDGWPSLATAVADLPPSVNVYPLTLRMAPDDARSAAAEAWELSAVARRTGALVGRLEAAADHPHRGSAPDALRRYVELALPAYRFFVGIPQLPAELLPVDWPAPRLVAALAAVRANVGVAAEAYVRQVLDAS